MAAADAGAEAAPPPSADAADGNAVVNVGGGEAFADDCCKSAHSSSIAACPAGIFAGMQAGTLLPPPTVLVGLSDSADACFDAKLELPGAPAAPGWIGLT